MPTQIKDAKPRRMHGITPTPFEIPAEHRPQPKKFKSRRPLLFSIVAVYFFIRAGVSLLLALVPWSNPGSKTASYLIANPALVLNLLPRAFRPTSAMVEGAQSTLVQGLPFLFLVCAVLFAVFGWRLWSLSSNWRWATMLWSIYAVAKTVISLSSRYVGAAEAPLSGDIQLAVFAGIAWNLLIIGYLGFYPGVKEAFEKQKY